MSERSHPEARRTARRPVLVVDDSASVRRRVRVALEGAGYTVVEAPDGAAALAAIDANRPVMVLTDLNMGEMSGVELVAKIRARHDRAALPVVVFSSQVSAEVKSQGRAAGANGWLAKPVDAARVRSVVDYLVEKYAS